MNKSLIKLGVRNIIYVVTAQVIAYVLSLLTSFVLPNFLGVEQFGYWQIYLFYSAYFGIFCLGFSDGIYLRYGKFEYNELPKHKLHSALIIFIVMLLIFVILINFLIIYEQNPMLRFSYQFASFSIFILGCNSFFVMIYQVTNRMKEYSFVTIIDKITLMTTILVLLASDFDDFKIILAIDVITKVMLLLINIYSCRQIVFTKGIRFLEAFKEFQKNILTGINLMIANIMGMLLLGIGRIIIEHYKSIEEYGLYAFALSTTNLALMFVTAVGLVLYPIITRMSENQKVETFKMLNSIITLIIFCMMLFYFLVYWIINNILTDYLPVLNYLFILFPIVVAQSKLQLVISTYYNVLRKEKAMLRANFSSIVVFLVIAIPLFIIFNNVISIAVSTLITLLWRCYTSEIYLKKIMGIDSFINILEELLMIIGFIVITFFGDGTLSLVAYLVILSLYIIRKRNEISLVIKQLKNSLN